MRQETFENSMYLSTTEAAIEKNKKELQTIPVKENLLMISFSYDENPFFYLVQGSGMCTYTNAKAMVSFLVEQMDKAGLLDELREQLKTYKP